MELERERSDLLIIAHESVLRVLYGYLMACNATDIPKLSFPRNQIIEIVPESYSNRAVRIPILDLQQESAPNSPEGPRSQMSPTGMMTPVNIGEALSGTMTPLFSGQESPEKNTGYRGTGSMLLVERALKGSGESLQPGKP